MIQERVEDQLTRSAKSPLTLLHHRGVKPPLPRGGQGDFRDKGEGDFRSLVSLLGGILGECPDNREATNMKAKGMEKFTADSCNVRRLRRVLEG